MARFGGSVLPYLIRTVDRYGEAIEFDLHAVFGLDLIDFFRRRYSWRKLAALIGQLPSTSRFVQAVLEDEERAAEQLAAEREAKKAGRPVVAPLPMLPRSEYSTEAAKLDAVAALLGGILSVLTGGKYTPRDPVVPETARDRLLERESRRRVEALMGEVFEAQRRWAAGVRA